jgi:Flp pilus assembly protein TadB
MLWFIVALATLAVLIVALVHLSVWIGRRQAKHDEEENRHSDDHNSHRRRNFNKSSIAAIAAGIDAIRDTLEAQRRQQNHHEISRSSLEKIGVFAAIIAAILAGLSAIIFQKQLYAMRFDQRAWMKIVTIAPYVREDHLVPDGLRFFKDKFPAFLGLHVVIQNVGRSPALNVHIGVHALLIPLPPHSCCCGCGTSR